MGQKITKIAGNALGTTYAAWIAQGSGYGLPNTTAVNVPRMGLWPRFTALHRPTRRFTLNVVVLSGGGDTERKNLFDWLDPEGESTIVLTATDEDGSSNERYLNIICTACQPAGYGDRPDVHHFVASCVVDGDVRWRKTTADTQEWLVTGTGDTQAITNGGEDDAYLKLTVTPTAVKDSGASGSYAYQRWVPIIWKAAAGDTSYPTQIDGLDTAALVATATASTLSAAFNAGVTTCPVTDASSFPTAGMAYITDAVTADEQIKWTGKSGNDLTGVTRGIGGTGDVNHSGGQAIAVSKMLANGDDLRVFVDGTEDEDRWLEDINTADTDIWVNLDWSAEQSTTLAAGIGSGDTVTDVDVDDVSGFPSSGILLINSEAFVYTGLNTTDDKFTGVTRAMKGTSAAAHNVADDVYWIQNDIWLVYDNESASAPSTDADYKPAFKLSTSTNTSWVYEEFGEDDGLRTGGWTSSTVAGTPTFYNGNRTAAADPWDEIGLTTDSTSVQTAGHWAIYNPCYITNANFTNGEKRSTVKASFVAYIQSSTVGAYPTPDVTEYTIPVPAANNTWEAWSRNETITANKTYVMLYCASVAVPVVVNDVEAADCTLTLDSTYTPDVTINSESAVDTTYTLAATITNNTTSEAISLAYSMDIDDELEIDTPNYTVTDLGDDSSQMQALTIVSGPRRHWLKAAVGSNTLQYDETGVTGVTVDLEWEERHYS